MQLRPARFAFILASAAVLAACQGTVGTVEGDAPTTSQTTDGALTSGAGDGSVSSTDTTVTETGDADTSAEAPAHPLDDPSGSLSVRTIYFDFDSSEVPESQRGSIEAHALYLSAHPGGLITLEGHADERGSREYNIALGERRADTVRKLMTLLGANGSQIRTISYGEERPTADGHDESAWRLNRRVEIIYRNRE